MIALQILAVWFALSCITAAVYSAFRERQKRKAVAEYELLADRYLKCIEVAYRVEERGR